MATYLLPFDGSSRKQSSGTLFDRSRGGIIIWQGQEIPAEVRIGRVEMTGRTTGSHLHWGLKNGDQYINPGLVIKEMFRYQVSS